MHHKNIQINSEQMCTFRLLLLTNKLNTTIIANDALMYLLIVLPLDNSDIKKVEKMTAAKADFKIMDELSASLLRSCNVRLIRI